MARILIVDDDEDIRILATQIISESGHETLCASDAMEAMEFLNSYRIDLALIDIEMPYTNGLQLSQSLRATLRHKFLPIIFISARNEKKDIERALQLQADNYIIKPIQKETLLAAIDSVFKKTKPKEHTRIDVSQTTLSAKADVIKRIPAKLLFVSELGVTIESTCQYEHDEILHLDTSLFNQADVPSLPLKVNYQKHVGPNKWETTLAFSELNQNFMMKLKSWILAQQLKKPSS